MVKRAASKGLDLIPHHTDIAETKVYWNGKHVGNVRVRYTPDQTFDDWAFGRLLGAAPTLAEAAKLLTDTEAK